MNPATTSNTTTIPDKDIIEQTITECIMLSVALSTGNKPIDTNRMLHALKQRLIHLIDMLTFKASHFSKEQTISLLSWTLLLPNTLQVNERTVDNATLENVNGLLHGVQSTMHMLKEQRHITDDTELNRIVTMRRNWVHLSLPNSDIYHAFLEQVHQQQQEQTDATNGMWRIIDSIKHTIQQGREWFNLGADNAPMPELQTHFGLLNKLQLYTRDDEMLVDALFLVGHMTLPTAFVVSDVIQMYESAQNDVPAFLKEKRTTAHLDVLEMAKVVFDLNLYIAANANLEQPDTSVQWTDTIAIWLGIQTSTQRTPPPTQQQAKIEDITRAVQCIRTLRPRSSSKVPMNAVLSLLLRCKHFFHIEVYVLLKWLADPESSISSSDNDPEYALEYALLQLLQAVHIHAHFSAFVQFNATLLIHHLAEPIYAIYAGFLLSMADLGNSTATLVNANGIEELLHNPNEESLNDNIPLDVKVAIAMCDDNTKRNMRRLYSALFPEVSKVQPHAASRMAQLICFVAYPETSSSVSWFTASYMLHIAQTDARLLRRSFHAMYPQHMFPPNKPLTMQTFLQSIVKVHAS